MTTAGPLLVAAAMLLVVAVDLGGYVVAAARAQSAADATAAAVVVAAVPPVRAPRGEAHRVAAMNGARLESCGCPAGADRVIVEVSVPVRALVATRLGPRRVRARATARLVPRP